MKDKKRGEMERNKTISEVFILNKQIFGRHEPPSVYGSGWKTKIIWKRLTEKVCLASHGLILCGMSE